MVYTRLGNTGCQSADSRGLHGYGDPQPPLRSAGLADAAAQPFFRPAMELGNTFWGTANVCQDETSEELVGRDQPLLPARRHRAGDRGAPRPRWSGPVPQGGPLR